jgi:hypothetical protein
VPEAHACNPSYKRQRAGASQLEATPGHIDSTSKKKKKSQKRAGDVA